jgi:SAM-dependent methyltransferase
VRAERAASFARVADAYERARPGYPADAVLWLAGEAPCDVVDLGAGTGKLTRSLAALGHHVVAVEPLAEMRAQLEAIVPEADVLAGTAEDLPLEEASADAVTVGQAFHWFDPGPAAAEIARVLRPGGALALVWNIRDLADPLQERINRLLRPVRRDTPSEHEQPWRTVLAGSAAFGPADERSFEWVQRHTTAELLDRIASVSFVARLDQDARAALLERVRGEVDDLPQPFDFRYRTDVYVFPRV